MTKETEMWSNDLQFCHQELINVLMKSTFYYGVLEATAARLPSKMKKQAEYAHRGEADSQAALYCHKIGRCFYDSTH